MEQQIAYQPPQHQNIQPGIEAIMEPPPKSEMDDYQGIKWY
ncbi:hypothetical protein [Chitinimonas sp. BJB300]|nr:hypothetical protein [Chitinimonas sp. BJB300]